MGVTTTLAELRDRNTGDLIKYYVERKWSPLRLARRYGYDTKEDGIELLESHGIPIRRGRSLSTKKQRQGYTIVKHNGKWVPEHRLVWEQANGSIPKGWIIYPLNGIRNDIRLENLLSIPRTKNNTAIILRATETRIIDLEKQVCKLEETIEIYEQGIFTKKGSE